jgi:hypothetical protein
MPEIIVLLQFATRAQRTRNIRERLRERRTIARTTFGEAEARFRRRRDRVTRS